MFSLLFQAGPGADDGFAFGVGGGAIEDLVVLAVVGLEDFNLTLEGVPAVSYNIKIIDVAPSEFRLFHAIGA